MVRHPGQRRKHHAVWTPTERERRAKPLLFGRGSESRGSEKSGL